LVSILEEAEWTFELVWTFWRRGKLLALPGIEPRLLGSPAFGLVPISTELSDVSHVFKININTSTPISPERSLAFRFSE
jgi:hypothetical protein